MQQGIPEFPNSDDALRLRQFLYERWCAGATARTSETSTKGSA
jgi:hypothetical protein